MTDQASSISSTADAIRRAGVTIRKSSFVLGLVLTLLLARSVSAALVNIGLLTYGGTASGYQVMNPELAFDGDLDTYAPMTGTARIDRTFVVPEIVQRVRAETSMPPGATFIEARLLRKSDPASGSWTVVRDYTSMQALSPGRVAIVFDNIAVTDLQWGVAFRSDVSLQGEKIYEMEIYAEGIGLEILVTAGTEGVVLSWSGGSGPYDIYRDEQYLITTADTSYIDEHYPTGATVTYKVVDSEDLEGSDSVFTCPAAPAVSVVDTTTESVTISWQEVTTALSYNVYRGVAFVGNTASLTWTDGNLAPDTTLTYSVAAVNGAGEGRAGTVQATTEAQPPPPDAPVNLRTTARYVDSLSVAWDPVAGVGGYKVYLDGSLYGLTTSPAANISGLTAGTEYAIRVRAYTGIYDGAVSSALVVSTVGPPGPVTSLQITPGAVSLALSWLAPASLDPAESYSIYLDGEPAGNTVSLSYLLMDLSTNTGYEVGVAAVNAAGEGPLVVQSVTTLALPVPAGPVQGLAASSTIRTVRVTWDPHPEASAYRVHLNGVDQWEGPLCEWAAAGLVPLTEYQITVFPINEAGAGEGVSVYVTTKDGSPSILKVTPGGSGYILTYAGPEGVDAPDEYLIYADDVLRTTAYIPSQWPDTDMGWSTGTNHDIRVDARYGLVTASDTATIAAYVAVSPVEYPPAAGLMESVLQDWSGIVMLVTAFSSVWIVWDWWRGLMRRDPFGDTGD